MSAGLYLKLIRERRRISRAKLAEKLGVSEQTIWNIEHWAKDPTSSLLFAFVDAIQASTEDLGRLLRAEDEAKAETEARRMAEYRLTPRQQAKIEAFTAEIGVENAADAAELVRNDPDLRRAIIRLADALRDAPH